MMKSFCDMCGKEIDKDDRVDLTITIDPMPDVAFAKEMQNTDQYDATVDDDGFITIDLMFDLGCFYLWFNHERKVKQ